MEGSTGFDEMSSGQWYPEHLWEVSVSTDSDYNAKLLSLLEWWFIDEKEYNDLLK